MPRLWVGNARFRPIFRPFAVLMPELLSTSFLIAAAIAFIGGMVRGFAGFGAAMIMTPVFSALYGPAFGIALCLLMELVVVVPLLPEVVRQVDWRRIGLLVLAAAVGAPLGNLALTHIPAEPMRWVISAIVLGAVVLLSTGWRYQGKPVTAATLAAGTTSGFLNGLSGMAGPPIIFYYMAGTDSAAQVRANLTTYFVFVDLIAVSVFAARSLIGWDTVLHGLCIAPFVVVGGLVGQRLFPLASEAFYRRVALGLLVAIAIGVLVIRP
jgi:uncharacterized membrane protein YfcA